MLQRICVYCGSSPGNDEIYTRAAQDLANAIVQNNIELVYGGATKGTMGILADAVLERGGAVHGVIPKLLEEKEIAHTGLTKLHVVTSMHERRWLHRAARWFWHAGRISRNRDLGPTSISRETMWPAQCKWLL
jgi:uncharacterized protein (TIGR00730 family)